MSSENLTKKDIDRFIDKLAKFAIVAGIAFGLGLGLSKCEGTSTIKFDKQIFQLSNGSTLTFNHYLGKITVDNPTGHRLAF